jgi:hypothetical protein
VQSLGVARAGDGSSTRRAAPLRVLVAVVAVYLTAPPLLFTSWLTVVDLFALDWPRFGVLAVMAGSGVAIAVVSVRAWLREPGSGVRPALWVIGWAGAVYALALVSPLIF